MRVRVCRYIKQCQLSRTWQRSCHHHGARQRCTETLGRGGRRDRHRGRGRLTAALQGALRQRRKPASMTTLGGFCAKCNLSVLLAHVLFVRLGYVCVYAPWLECEATDTVGEHSGSLTEYVTGACCWAAKAGPVTRGSQDQAGHHGLAVSCQLQSGKQVSKKTKQPCHSQMYRPESARRRRCGEVAGRMALTLFLTSSSMLSYRVSSARLFQPAQNGGDVGAQSRHRQCGVGIEHSGCTSLAQCASLM